MAGFEVIVRPVIFPDIRPRAKPSLAPDDPEKGLATITGNPASAVGLSESWSVSTSHSNPVETQRRVDETRVYQMDDSGEVNRDNFVDIQVANKITMREPVGDGGNEKRDYFYKRAEEKKNIEIRKKDTIVKSDDQSE